MTVDIASTRYVNIKERLNKHQGIATKGLNLGVTDCLEEAIRIDF